MTEAEYVRTTNLERSRMCLHLLQKMLPGPEVDGSELREMMRVLANWEIKLSAVIQTDHRDPYPIEETEGKGTRTSAT